jgi:hypothetical protein
VPVIDFANSFMTFSGKLALAVDQHGIADYDTWWASDLI